MACTGVPETEPVLTRDEGAHLHSLVDGGDEHARTGRGDLLVIRGGRLALLGTQRSLERRLIGEGQLRDAGVGLRPAVGRTNQAGTLKMQQPRNRLRQRPMHP